MICQPLGLYCLWTCEQRGWRGKARGLTLLRAADEEWTLDASPAVGVSCEDIARFKTVRSIKMFGER